jgi:ABC-type Fe3+ transport system substrate-binding protein
MTTITLKINEKTKNGKAFLALAKVFYEDNKDVELITDKSPYNPKYVAMIKNSAKQKTGKIINPNDVWASLE